MQSLNNLFLVRNPNYTLISLSIPPDKIELEFILNIISWFLINKMYPRVIFTRLLNYNFDLKIYFCLKINKNVAYCWNNWSFFGGLDYLSVGVFLN